MLVLTRSYLFCVNCRCLRITDQLTNNRNFVCRKCSGEIVPKIGNNTFHVESTFKYLGDTIGQCGGCSDAVSAHIV